MNDGPLQYYQYKQAKVLEDLQRRFDVLRKCKNKFDCSVQEMLFIRDLKPTQIVQSDSIRIKLLLYSNPAFHII